MQDPGKIRSQITTLLVLAPFIAAAYGFLHDQITCTLSPEYFTKLKFPQFFGDSSQLYARRDLAGIVGILATWWTSIFIGPAIAWGVSKWHREHIFRKGFAAYGIVLIIAFACGWIGWYMGKNVVNPDAYEIIDRLSISDAENFIAVGGFHLGSYAGALIGLAGAVFYLWYTGHRENPPKEEEFWVGEETDEPSIGA